MAARSFVAIGDSFTEGLDDPYPGGSSYRGWADLVAFRLAEVRRASAATCDHHGGEFRYANLAIRGRLFDAVVAEQVPAAIEMRPDLFAFAAGGNDVLRRGFDAAALLGRFDRVVAQLRTTGAEVLLFRFIDLSRRLPGKRLLRPRIGALNEGVLATGRRHGARVVELGTDPAFEHPQMWSADRLHLSATGHRRVAAHVLATLGVPHDPDWLRVPSRPTAVDWLGARRSDARWVTDHLAPWVHRRLKGTSSGDTREPKRPTLVPIN